MLEESGDFPIAMYEESTNHFHEIRAVELDKELGVVKIVIKDKST